MNATPSDPPPTDDVSWLSRTGNRSRELPPLPAVPSPGLEPSTALVARHTRNGRTWRDRLGADRVRAGLVAGGAVLVLMVVRLFGSSPVGLADDGSGFRYVCRLGLTPDLSSGAGRYFDFALLRWQTTGAVASCPPFPYSETLLLWLARAVSGGTVLDLRLVMVGYAVLAALAVGLITAAVPVRGARRVLVAVVAFLVLADGVLADLAGSVHGEYAAVVGLVLLGIGVALGDDGRDRRWAGRALIVVGGALTAMSSGEAAGVILPLALVLGLRTARRAVRSGAGWARRGRPLLWVPAAALVVAGAAWVGLSLAESTSQDRQHDAWQVIALQILPATSNPEGALAVLGLPPELKTYSGQSVDGAGSIAQTRYWELYASQMTPTNVDSYLITHPATAVSVLDQAARDLLLARPATLGTFTPGADAERTVETRVVVYSTLTGLLAPLGLAGLLVLWLGTGYLVWGSVRGRNDGDPGFALAESASVLLGGGAVVFLAIVAVRPVVDPHTVVVPVVAQALALALALAAWVTAKARSEAVAVPESVPQSAEPVGASAALVPARAGLDGAGRAVGGVRAATGSSDLR